MIGTVAFFVVAGSIIGAAYALIYSLHLEKSDDDVTVSCLFLGLMFGLISGTAFVKNEAKLNEMSKLQSEMIEIKLESERIKQQAVNAGLGYWREETAVVKRVFIIASQTEALQAERGE